MVRRPFSHVFILVLVLACGCASVGDDLAGKIVEELLASHIGALAWAIAWRCLVFGLLGVGLGLGAFLGLRKLGAFRFDWPHALWVRALTGAHELISEGQLATEVLPIAGDAGSLMIASIYVGSEVGSELLDGAELEREQLASLEARVGGYANGEWEMDHAMLEARLDDVHARVVEIAVELARREVYERYPKLEGTLGDDVVSWVLDRFGAKLTKQLAESVSESAGVGMIFQSVQEVFTTLDEAAAREGDEAQLSHVELRAHVVEVGVVPMLTGPVDEFARGQRLTGILALLAFVIVTIGGFALARHLYEQRAAEQRG
jgi:hypothetical protein